MSEEEPPFYGYDIIRRTQEEIVSQILAKYKGEAVTDELKQKIWDELQMEKHHGNLTMPFKLAVRRDIYGKYPEFIEIILDTKV